MEEVLITRILHARPWKVFKAWTNEKLLANWWGPAGVIIRKLSIDATRGGEISIEMRTSEGKTYVLKGNFKLIDEPEQLVFSCSVLFGDHKKLKFRTVNTVIFLPEEYNTRITLQTVVMYSAPGTSCLTEHIAVGWNESLDKLEKLMLQLRFNCFQK